MDKEVTYGIKKSTMIRILGLLFRIRNPVVPYDHDHHKMALAVIEENRKNAQEIEGILNPCGLIVED